jgi:glycosyltransferase involved in cell wall biosynthesis
MKILVSSYTFAPNVGGIESVSKILTEKFVEAGHEVRVVTETPGDLQCDNLQGEGQLSSLYHLTRRPSLFGLRRLLNWCDVFFQNNISLRSLIPALFVRKPILIVHQTWLRDSDGGIGWINRAKRALLTRATNVAISRAILDDIDAPGSIIGNPYNDRVFRIVPNVTRDKSLVFLGRLVSDKGADILLQAMKILRQDHLRPDLTIIGSGPERENLEHLAQALELREQITFAGEKSGEELAGLLNRHRIMVVPSRWREPFGIVALEGIACGCVIVGSRQGGLGEAIGPCGLTFENGNVESLAACLKQLLVEPASHLGFQKEATNHLAKFQADAVASAYLKLLQQLIA